MIKLQFFWITSDPKRLILIEITIHVYCRYISRRTIFITNYYSWLCLTNHNSPHPTLLQSSIPYYYQLRISLTNPHSPTPTPTLFDRQFIKPPYLKYLEPTNFSAYTLIPRKVRDTKCCLYKQGSADRSWARKSYRMTGNVCHPPPLTARRL
jgi:hypothetical protein